MLRNFQFNVWLKVLLLSLSIALLTWLLQTTSMFVTEVIVGFVVVYQIYDLVQYVERTNRRLANIFEAIRYSDFTRSFSMRKSHDGQSRLKYAAYTGKLPRAFQ